MRRVLVTFLLAGLACSLFADTRFYVDQRTDYQKGREWGQAGPWELITAKVVTDSGEGRAEVLKPRDPKKGNGVLILEVNGGGKLRAPESLLQSGSTLVRLHWKEPGTLQAGVAETLTFLHYKGGPMLLGDQSRFVKKVIAIDNGEWLNQFVMSPGNRDPKGRVLIDGALRGEDARNFDLSKVQAFTQ